VSRFTKFTKDLPRRNNQVFFKRCHKKKSLMETPPLSAKDCWEFFFSSGPVIKKKLEFFWRQGFSEAAHCASRCTIGSL
jgi:hypothetical protein